MWTIEKARTDLVLFWSTNDSNHLSVKLKMFKKDGNRDFRLVQDLTLGGAVFNQFMRLKKQLVNAARIFGGEESSSPVLRPTMSKDRDEKLKLSHKVVGVVDRPYKKSCVTLMRYNMDKTENSYAQSRLLAGKKENEKFQQFIWVIFKLEGTIYLLDVINTV